MCDNTYLAFETRLIALERALARLSADGLASPAMRAIAIAAAALAPATAAEDAEAFRRHRLWRALFAPAVPSTLGCAIDASPASTGRALAVAQA